MQCYNLLRASEIAIKLPLTGMWLRMGKILYAGCIHITQAVREPSVTLIAACRVNDGYDHMSDD
jgi:hypothetical protein